MRRFIVVASLLLSSAAVAQTPGASEPAKPLYRFPGLPETPVAGPARGPIGPRGQLFVAPSGEPFRAEPGEPYPIIRWFAQADTDHDGKLDRTEFTADFDRFFAVLDINHDALIDPSEVTRYERDVVPEVAAGEGFGGGFGPGPGGRGRGRPGGGRRYAIAGSGAGGGAGEGAAAQDSGGGDIQAPPPRRSEEQPILGAGRYGIINIPQPISSMDINLDGTITPFEMRQAATRRFSLLDIDRRGILRLSDLPQTPAQRSGEGNRRRRDRGEPPPR